MSADSRHPKNAFSEKKLLTSFRRWLSSHRSVTKFGHFYGHVVDVLNIEILHSHLWTYAD
jgi:hypothetical protein